MEYWRLGLGIYLTGFLNLFGGAMCLTYVPLYAADLGASKGTIGVVMSMQMAGLLTADLPAGLLVARLGTSHAMVLGQLGMAAAFALAAMLEGVAMLGGCLYVAGFCAALVQISQLTIMRHAMPDHLRGRALALYGGNIRLARVVAPVLGGMLVQVAGFRSVFWCYSALLGVACVLFLVFGPRQEWVPTGSQQGMLSGIARLARSNARILVTAGGTLLMLAMLRTSRNTLLPLWGREMGLTPVEIGGVISIGAAVDTLLFPLSGFISDKKGRKCSLGASIGIFSFALLVLALIGGSMVGFVAATVLIGVGNGLSAGINMTVGSDLAPKGTDAGPFLGLWRMTTDTGGMLGPMAVGGIAEILGFAPAAVVIGAAGLGCVALMGRFMPESRGYRR